jgi:hypothetical protein
MFTFANNKSKSLFYCTLSKKTFFVLTNRKNNLVNVNMKNERLIFILTFQCLQNKRERNL